MRQASCGSCIHFLQHYTFDRKKIFRIHCGHCVFRKAKARKPDAKICESYEQRSPDEESFVSKEFLSRELLSYMMKLELLPEIQDAER